MKVLALLILVVAAASAKSGPYLPSGWRPQGPAFYLPSEVATTSKNPLRDTIVESEASGSDFLREYGPPKIEEVSQDISNQGLPDVITDQPFFIIETKINEEDVKKSSNDLKEIQLTETKAEVISEIKSTTEKEFVTATEYETTEKIEAITLPTVEKLLEAEIKEGEIELGIDKATDIEIIEEKLETAAREAEDASSNLAASVREQEEKSEERVEEVKSVGRVNNIADALTTLENEIKAKQVQNLAVSVESKTTQEASTSSNLEGAPEGFLEYGPPGFTEYGPPKEQPSAAVVTAEKSQKQVAENETRRRRFSPKFRTPRKSH